jgi:hypothetical protein
MIRRAAAAAMCVSLLAAAPGWAPAATGDDQVPVREVKATPQRPAKVFNASTTAPGYLELEAGWSHDSGIDAAEVNLKLGLGRRSEIYFGLRPWVASDQPTGTETGLGDTVIGGRFRFFESREGAAAFAGFVKFPTADDDKGLGSGDTDAGFRFIASRDWGLNHWDFNLGGDFAGVPDSSSNEARWTTILTWSRPLQERYRYYAEIFVQYLPAFDEETVTVDGGISYALNPSFVLDAGVNVGLSDDAPDVQVLVGLTKVLGKALPGRARLAAPTPDPAP